MLLDSSMHLAIGLIVGAPLVYAGVSKVLDPGGFAEALPRFGLWWRDPDTRLARAVGLAEIDPPYFSNLIDIR